MANTRTCLNCKKDISHRDLRATTCNAACRNALKRKRKANSELEEVENELHEGRRSTIVKRAVEREVRALVQPVVREALTEDVLRAMEDLVRLTPDAVQTLADHMHSEDAVLAQKAATTVMRYTVGHQALVTPEAATAPQIVVNFDLPRPSLDADITTTEAYDDTDPTHETFECDVCHEEQLVLARVAGSDRCITCHESRKQAVLEQYGLV